MDTSSTSPTPPRDDIAALKAQIVAKDALIAILEEKLRLAATQHFAPKSEKLASLALRDWTSPEKVEGFSDRFCESEEQEWAS